jgi:hypothetical protein
MLSPLISNVGEALSLYSQPTSNSDEQSSVCQYPIEPTSDAVAPFEERILHDLVEFRKNAAFQTMHQLNQYKTKKVRTPFPTDGVIKIAGIPYEYLPAKVCNATALSVIEYLKDQKLIAETPTVAFREEGIDQSKDEAAMANLPFSANRICLGFGKDTFDHEFALIKLQTKAILIQSDVCRQMQVEDEGGWIELTSEEVDKLFANDAITIAKLFKRKFEKLYLRALDHYSLQFLI